MMNREKMLEALEEVVTMGTLKRFSKLDDEKLYKKCVEYGVVDTRSESEKEYVELRKEIRSLKGELKALCEDKCADIFGAVNGVYFEEDTTSREAEIREKLEELKNKMEKNEHYRFLNNTGMVRWDS